MKKTNKGGRPSKFTPDTIKKLDEAFAMGCSDVEACLYADVSTVALWNYERRHRGFLKHKEALKEKPVLKARKTVIDSLNDPKTAQWYLERKKKSEFAERTEVSGVDGEPLLYIVEERKPEK